MGDHGFSTGDEVVFRASEGGSVPAPLLSGVTYFVLYLNDFTFQVSAALNGDPITLTSDGVSLLVATPLPFCQVLQFYSRFADAFMPAHLVPFTAPYPITVVAIVAELSSKKLQQLAGHESASVAEFELAAKAQLERWAKGLPLRDVNATPPANLSSTHTLVKYGVDPRGWGSGILPGGRYPGGNWPGNGAL